MNPIMMSTIFLACLLLVLTGAHAKDRQIKLEDIERDNLAAERNAKGLKPVSPQLSNNAYLPKPSSLLSHPAGTPTPPRMQFGFVPLKEPGYQQPQYQQYYQYAQAQPQPHQEYQYVTPNPAIQQVQSINSGHRYANPHHLHTHTQAYFPTSQSSSRHSHAHQHPNPQPHIQYAQPQVTETPEQEYHQGRHTQAYLTPIQTQEYQQYMHQQQIPLTSSHPTHTQVQYVPSNQIQYQQHQQQQQAQYVQPQIQYIVDNSIQQQPTEQQKYYPQQQYVYLQPYQTPSASNNIHSVSDPKGNVQYVMYIPTAAAYPTETVLAYPTNQEEYVYQSQTPAQIEETKTAVSQEEVNYPEEKPYRQIQRPVFKHQPTSLLDSYVPSILQYEYYKQQQRNANALKQSTKLSNVGEVGKGDVVKTYKDNSGSNY